MKRNKTSVASLLRAMPGLLMLVALSSFSQGIGPGGGANVANDCTTVLPQANLNNCDLSGGPE